MLTLGGNAQNSFDAAIVSDIYGAEVNSALFELQAHYQMPNMGAVASPLDSKDDGPTEETIQGAVSESANAGIDLTPVQWGITTRHLPKRTTPEIQSTLTTRMTMRMKPTKIDHKRALMECKSGC